MSILVTNDFDQHGLADIVVDIDPLNNLFEVIHVLVFW